MPRALLLFLLLLGACARPGDVTIDCDPSLCGPVAWTHTVRADHPLVGRIWDPKAGAFIAPAAALGRAASADHILLGERHDNADHHLLQARFARAALPADPGRTIAMEMLTPEQGPAARDFLAARPQDAAGFGEAVGWARTGWPDWAIYRPIGEVALATGATMVPANLTREEVRRLRAEGPAAITRERWATLALDRPIPPALRQAMEQEIASSHCGMLPAAALGPFAGIQWARDAAMAAALRDAGRAILIAGAGHVRTDRGVPMHLAALAPGKRVLAIAFVEVSAELTDPASRDWPYDLVWFTPRVDEVDPCVRFRERMRPADRPAASAPT